MRDLNVPLAVKPYAGGLVLDIRMAPRELQVQALELGLIPYLPGVASA